MARGKLECWVDILTKSEALKQPVVDISMAPPALFEMRMVIYQAKNVPALDVMTKMNDMFVSTHAITLGPIKRRNVLDIV